MGMQAKIACLYYSQMLCQSPGGGGGTRYISGWGGAARPLIP